MEARWIPRVIYPPTNICTHCTDTVDNRASFVILATIYLSFFRLYFSSLLFSPFFPFFPIALISLEFFPIRHRDANPLSHGSRERWGIYEQRSRKYRWTSDIYGIEECNDGQLYLSYNSVERFLEQSRVRRTCKRFWLPLSVLPRMHTRDRDTSYVIGTNCHGSFSFDYFFR